MLIKLDPHSPNRPYEQIYEKLMLSAVSGKLAAGTRLPTVRQLADDLEVAPGTVARAYKELEANGIIVTNGRHGTFVKKGLRLSGDAREQLQSLTDAAQQFAKAAKRVGASEEEAVLALRKNY